MTDLLTLLREHDLPPHWDGLTVTWSPWDDGTLDGLVFICPPPKPEKCPACRKPAPTQRARGVIHNTWALTAYRCTNCAHDQVLDVDTGELWDLDPSDYGPGGSRRPA